MLTTVHSVPTSADEVLVTTGAQQALDLLVRCEVTPGQACVTEDPTFPGILDAAQRSGGTPTGDIARIADAVAVHRPALVCLIPSFHNPTGLLMPAGARRDLVELARRHPDVTFIDDMTMADVAFGDDRRHRRWVRAPEGIIARLAAAKAAADLGSPPRFLLLSNLNG
jgi:DNA-binding transcriptional MocR family regulator